MGCLWVDFWCVVGVVVGVVVGDDRPAAKPKGGGRGRKGRDVREASNAEAHGITRKRLRGCIGGRGFKIYRVRYCNFDRRDT